MQTTKKKSLSLAPGRCRIEIRNGEFTPYKETIEVKSGAAASGHLKAAETANARKHIAFIASAAENCSVVNNFRSS